MPYKEDMLPKGPGAIGKPLVMPAGMKPLPGCSSGLSVKNLLYLFWFRLLAWTAASRSWFSTR